MLQTGRVFDGLPPATIGRAAALLLASRVSRRHQDELYSSTVPSTYSTAVDALKRLKHIDFLLPLVLEEYVR